jgi:hypothetical protein
VLTCGPEATKIAQSFAWIHFIQVFLFNVRLFSGIVVAHDRGSDVRSLDKTVEKLKRSSSLLFSHLIPIQMGADVVLRAVSRLGMKM